MPEELSKEEKEIQAKKLLLKDEEPFIQSNLSEEDREKLKVIEDLKQSNNNSLQEEKSNIHAIASSIGFRDISDDKIPSKIMFYEEGRKFKIRALTPEELKNYSEMNESNYLDVEQHLNDLIDTSTKVILGKSNILGTVKDISIFDKIFFLFAIRDLTMRNMDRETKLIQPVKHPISGDIKNVDINNDTFGYYEIPKGIMKYYSEIERCFIIDEFEGEPPLKVYIPTIGVNTYLASYTQRQLEKLKTGEGSLDEKFVAKSQYLIKSWRSCDVDDVFITNLYNDYKNWSYDKFMSYDKLISILKVGINPNITVNFDTKDEGGNTTEKSVVVPVSFRSYKDIFNFSNKSRELFAD